jgi:hypothetical protein
MAARAVSVWDSTEAECTSCISLVRRVEYCLKFDFEAFPDADVIQFWYRGPVPLMMALLNFCERIAGGTGGSIHPAIFVTLMSFRLPLLGAP